MSAVPETQTLSTDANCSVPAQDLFVSTTKKYYELLKLRNSSTPNTFLRQHLDQTQEVLDQSILCPPSKPLCNINQDVWDLKPIVRNQKWSQRLTSTRDMNAACTQQPQTIIETIDLTEDDDDVIELPRPSQFTLISKPPQFRRPMRSMPSRMDLQMEIKKETQKNRHDKFQRKTSVPTVPLTEYKTLKRELDTATELVELSEKENKKLRRKTTLLSYGFTFKKRQTGKLKPLSDQIRDMILESTVIVPNQLSNPAASTTAITVSTNSRPQRKPLIPKNENLRTDDCSCMCYCSAFKSRSGKSDQGLQNIIPMTDQGWMASQTQYRQEFQEIAQAGLSSDNRVQTEENNVSESFQSGSGSSRSSSVGPKVPSQTDSGIGSSSEQLSVSNFSGTKFPAATALYRNEKPPLTVAPTMNSFQLIKATPFAGRRANIKKVEKMFFATGFPEKNNNEATSFSQHESQYYPQSQSLLSNYQHPNAKRRPLSSQLSQSSQSQRPSVPTYNVVNNSWSGTGCSGTDTQRQYYCKSGIRNPCVP